MNQSGWPEATDRNPSGAMLQGGLSVFFPAFNDGLSLPALLSRTFATLPRVANDYEVIVVNDGSTDDTAVILEQLEKQYAPHLRIITHRENLGYGAALRSGFESATKAFVFYTDGDAQYDPAELEELARAMSPGVCLVNGFKLKRQDPWHRIAIGWLYNRFARWLFCIRLRDIDCDFRLIRRDALDLSQIQSTGGTICVEIVRTLELNGDPVVEIPVHHYPRQYGRSQFFRVGSLATTFLQLCEAFFRLVVAPVLLRPGSAPTGDSRPFPSARAFITVAVVLTVLSMLAYGWAVRLPFISDDYGQISLARELSTLDGWSNLAGDALYRTLATSLVVIYLMDRAFGLNPVPYNLLSLGMHVVCSLLVFALGSWHRIGWRISAVAACVFAIGQRKSEAVVWISAMPELLVFFFVLLGFLSFIDWLQTRRASAYVATLLCFSAALLSKESAVALIPLCGIAAIIERRWTKLWGVLPLALIGSIYFGLIFLARQTHLHFNDGTFSLEAPFVQVLIRSILGLLWVWGVLSLPVLATSEARPWRPVLMIAGLWTIVTLLPYSFLTYMPQVPSRHTYVASVGRCLILAAAFLTCYRISVKRRWPWLVPVISAALVIHQCGYLWLRKSNQYANRAMPTEQLVRLGTQSGRPIHAKCFPYSPIVADVALLLTSPHRPVFLIGSEAARHADSIDFCNVDADGVHY